MRLKVSEWAAKFRRLSSEVSPEPGMWSNDRAPYQVEIMDEFSNPYTERITAMTSAQVGKTSILENVTGYFAHNDPCPMMHVHPRIEDAEDFSKDRLMTMIRDTPELAEAFGEEKSKTSGNTILKKKFFGGFLKMGGANSPASLAAKSIRVLLLDEVDRFPRSAGAEGDPYSLAVKRTNNFYNKKIGAFSTPTVKGRSKIEELYEQSDKRRYLVPCPNCKVPITFQFKQLKWSNKDPETTEYVCQECSSIIDENEKPWMLRSGKWVAEKPFKGHAGFHINELYSPWRKWKQIVADFLEAQKSPDTLKTWVNTALGETWEEKGDAPEWRRLYDRREPYAMNKIPLGGMIVTCGVDVQKDRLELEIKAWGRDRESWSIDYRVYMGDTAKAEVWEKLSQVVDEQWEHETGMVLPLRLMAVDSGYNTQHVYDFVRRFPPNKVVAIKGDTNSQVLVGIPKAVDVRSTGKRMRRGLKIWHVGVDLAKSELYGNLRKDKPTAEELAITAGKFPAGFLHFPEYGEDYFKQLTSESLISRVIKGRTHYEWVKGSERNEALDCHVYNRAAAGIIGLDRFKESDWIKASKSPGQPVIKPKVEAQAAPEPSQKPPKRKRHSDFWDR